jgi:RHS repeat-associated protein
MVGSVVAVLDRDRAANTHKQDFVYGQGIDEIVMLEQADVLDHDDDENTSELTRSFYHRNALGSVVEVTDALEATVCSYRYTPYGSVTITVGGTPQGSDPLAQHWTFTGRFFDEETGFYYYRVRTYDPATGRFLQRDPLGYGPGPNPYTYADANPVNHTDPLALDSWSWFEERQREMEEVGRLVSEGVERVRRALAQRRGEDDLPDQPLPGEPGNPGPGVPPPTPGQGGRCVCEIDCQYVPAPILGISVGAVGHVGRATVVLPTPCPPEAQCEADCNARADEEQQNLHNDLHNGRQPTLVNPATGGSFRWSYAPQQDGATFECRRRFECR